MLSDSVSYESFQSSNGGFANDYGPWRLHRSSVEDVNTGSTQPPWCQDVTYCLSAWVFPSSSQPSYTVSFFTKLAVNLTEYAGATTLDYQWQYLPWWGSTKSIVGSAMDIESTVGTQLYTDKLQVGNHTHLFTTNQGWNYAPFQHSGTINLQTNSDKTIGYVPLAINLTFPRQDAEYINYYVKGASFKITTPTTPIISHNTSLSPGVSDSGSNKISNGALVGGIIGAAAIVSFIIMSFVYIWKRTKQEPKYDEPEMAKVITESSSYLGRPAPSPIPFNIDNHVHFHPEPVVVPITSGNDGSTCSGQTITTTISPDQTGASTIPDTLSIGPSTVDHPPAYDARSPRSPYPDNRRIRSSEWVTFSKR